VERADFDVSPTWMNPLLTLWQRMEAVWLRWLDLPFGLSLVTLVRRK
jgi:hypothetical protein